MKPLARGCAVFCACFAIGALSASESEPGPITDRVTRPPVDPTIEPAANHPGDSGADFPFVDLEGRYRLI